LARHFVAPVQVFSSRAGSAGYPRRKRTSLTAQALLRDPSRRDDRVTMELSASPCGDLIRRMNSHVEYLRAIHSHDLFCHPLSEGYDNAFLVVRWRPC
jgi:hypothetical protein